MDIFEQIQHYIFNEKYGFESLFIVLGVFFIWSSISDWNWFYEPPYNSVKNPIGYWFGRKAFRINVFIFGSMMIVISGILIMAKY